MATANDRVIRDLVRRRKQLFLLEDKAASIINGEWAIARRELLANLLSLYDQLGSVNARLLLSDPRMQVEINAVLRRLQDRIVTVMSEFASGAQNNGLDEAAREIAVFARELGVGGVEMAATRGLDPVAIAVVQNIVEQIPGVIGPTQASLISELRRGLIAGDGFPDLVRSVLNLNLADRASVFRRGKTSVELFVRRSIIEANNASRQLFYEGAATKLAGLGKQAVATLDGKTTDTCLRVHGQIQPIDKPFILTGTPRFSDEMQHSPFHWRCRTGIVAHHPDFEDGSVFSTEAMRQAAREALQ